MAGINTSISPAITRLAAEQAAELTTIEAAHVYAAIKQMLEKLALVGVITVDPKVQAQELTQSVGEEITRMIAQQKRLEERFEELVSAQHTLRNLPNKSKLRENQAELQQVAEALRQSTKQLCRNLKDNPNVAENMAKVAAERQALALLMSNTLSELDVFRKVTPVLEAVLASESAKLAMEHTIEHERTTSSAVKQLRNDLKDERTDHDEKIRERKKMVGQLKEQLKEVKMSTAVETRYMAKDLTAVNEAARRLENASLADMRRELTAIQQQLDIEASVHAATVDFLKRLATRMQEESINWGSRHDDDLTTKDRDLEQLKQAHARDERRLREAEDKFRSELALKHERENQQAEERERQEMAALTHAKRVESALRIQALFRGYMVRKGLTGGKKGKKGGKGGAKKGKKK